MMVRFEKPDSASTLRSKVEEIKLIKGNGRDDGGGLAVRTGEEAKGCLAGRQRGMIGFHWSTRGRGVTREKIEVTIQ